MKTDDGMANCAAPTVERWMRIVEKARVHAMIIKKECICIRSLIVLACDAISMIQSIASRPSSTTRSVSHHFPRDVTYFVRMSRGNVCTFLISCPATMRLLASFVYATILAVGPNEAFSSISHTTRSSTQVFSSAPSDLDSSSSSSRTLNDLKDDLFRVCNRSVKPLLDEVLSIVFELEEKAEEAGIGQASVVSGLLAGRWELVYSPEDVTRSSPFFWAFRQAFPDQSDEIFAITDAIPSPIKEVGPAFQEIELKEGTFTGTFVSRVKVATLGGFATSVMTTR